MAEIGVLAANAAAASSATAAASGGLTALGATLIAAPIISSGVGVAGSIQQSRVQEDIADFQKGISDRNIAESERSAAFNKLRLRSDARRAQGITEARIGASGFQRSGSNAALALDTLIQSELDSAVALSRDSSILNQELVSRSEDSFRRSNAITANTQRGIGAVAQGALDLGRFSVLKNRDSLL